MIRQAEFGRQRSVSGQRGFKKNMCFLSCKIYERADIGEVFVAVSSDVPKIISPLLTLDTYQVTF